MNSDELYQRIQQVRMANGSNAKLALLCDYLRPYLLYAYDPYRHYSFPSLHCPGSGTSYIGLDSFMLLDKLDQRELTGHQARDTVLEHADSLWPLSALLFEMILHKDFSMGLGAISINKRFPGLIPEHPVMLAKPYDPEKATWPRYASPKIDGMRGIYRNGEMRTRKGELVVSVPHIVQACKDKGIRHGDFELVVPGMPRPVSVGKLLSEPNQPTAQAYIIDLPEYGVDFHTRYLEYNNPGIHGWPLLVLPQIMVHNDKEAYKLYKVARKIGHEGLILRTPFYKYVSKRVYDWMKWKAVKELDAKCLSIYEAKKGQKRLLGGAVIKVNGKLVKVGPGRLTHEERRFYWLNPDEIVGHYIEVLYQEKTHKGSLGHPRIYTVRKDK